MSTKVNEQRSHSFHWQNPAEVLQAKNDPMDTIFSHHRPQEKKM